MAASALFIDAELVIVELVKNQSVLPVATRNFFGRMALAAVPVIFFGQESLDAEGTLRALTAELSQELNGEFRLHLSEKLAAPQFFKIMHELQRDPQDSWGLIGSEEYADLLAQAAIGGAVCINCNVNKPPLGLNLKNAHSLADAPRVMIPAKGGCWHDHRA